MTANGRLNFVPGRAKGRRISFDQSICVPSSLYWLDVVSTAGRNQLLCEMVTTMQSRSTEPSNRFALPCL